MARELQNFSAADHGHSHVASGHDAFGAGGLREKAPGSAVLTVPNILSFMRLLLIPPFLTYYLQNRVGVAAAFFAAAAFTDVADGALARLLGQRSALGAVLDPLADKMLGLASLTALVLHDRLPVWLLGLSLLRDAVVLVVALWTRAAGVILRAAPSRAGKYATFFLNLAVILALSWEISYAPWLAGYVFATALIAGECLVVAAAQYAWRFRALRHAG